MNKVDTAIQETKQAFEMATKSMSTSDYIDVCSELADEFQVRADAAQADLDNESE
jgi:hypothetical protein